jgi:hypothetical protein
MDCCYSSSRIILQVRMTMLVPRGQEINDRHSINYFFHPPSSFIPTSTNSHSTPQCLLGTPLNRGPLPGKERPKLTLVLTAIRRSAKPARRQFRYWALLFYKESSQGRCLRVCECRTFYLHWSHEHGTCRIRRHVGQSCKCNCKRRIYKDHLSKDAGA